ncbi:transmembrane protein 140-like [Struthio camelus]|uniref:transmembrane protein 140-like n=1 Tax=Struthio camelus TaxID=8801 RepID=UPI00051E56A2|nr:PREDICTED: transmembrane protein 140-like isoform X1 [Struthio camelus australis]
MMMLFMAILSFVLMFYALFWEAGNLVDLPNKRLGFYNLCLWNEAAQKLQCLVYRDLEGIAVNPEIIKLAIFCAYSPMVFILFYVIFISFAEHTLERQHRTALWITPVFSATLLLVGLLLFLSQVWDWIYISDLSCAFLALVFSLVLMLLQALTAFRCLRLDRHED